MKKRSLSDEERTFFGLVARAAFSNPFSGRWRDLQQRIIETDGGSPSGLPPEKVADLALEAVERRTDALNRSSGGRHRSYGGVDGKLVRAAVLFDLFHRHTEDFDRLIEEQIDAGESACSVPFASTILGLLEERDFTRREALRHLAFFFQLRRAYFFIRRGLVGDSPSMRELRRTLWDSVFTSDIRWYERFLWERMEDFSTLILGETGTGKGTAAAAIGRSIFIPFDEKTGCFAESFTRNFIAVNLSRFPESLIESELFGHKKGAFTGAVDHYDGVLSRSSRHGAVLLDEIGDVSTHVQVKLLQVLQERTFSPVGSHEVRNFRSRVIAATNRPLDELRRSGEMREDFFYRLCSNTITVPPLRVRVRENPRELGLLLDRLLERILGERSPEMVRTVERILLSTVGSDYAWPGNVRELEQAVRRILLTRTYGGDRVPEAEDRRSTLHAVIEGGKADAREILSRYCALLYEEHGTYEAVARITGLDRRTVKKQIDFEGQAAGD